eukprot:2346017-Pyramimonas_sp.AAC.1
MVKSVAKRLQQNGTPAKAKTYTKDLGLDASAGRKRVVRALKRRILAAKRRFAMIKRLRKSITLAKEAKGLWSTGALPQATYGYQ